MYVLAVSYMYFQDFRDINLWYQWVYFSTARYKLKKKSLFEKHKYPFPRLAINKSAIPALQMSEHWPCEFFSSVNTRHVAIKLSSRWPKVTLIPHFCVFNWHIKFSKLWNCVGEDRTKIFAFYHENSSRNRWMHAKIKSKPNSCFIFIPGY